LSNTTLHGQVAAEARTWASACALGTRGVVVIPRVRTMDGFAVVPPSTHRAEMAALPTTLANYQDKTRIGAAGGGVTGSPPTWDPV
jgi:hypothetical protein